MNGKEGAATHGSGAAAVVHAFVPQQQRQLQPCRAVAELQGERKMRCAPFSASAFTRALPAWKPGAACHCIASVQG